MRILTKKLLSNKLRGVLKGDTTLKTLSDWVWYYYMSDDSRIEINVWAEAEDWNYGKTEREQRLTADVIFSLIKADIEKFQPSEGKLNYFLRCLEGQEIYSPKHAAALDATSST